MNGDDLPQISDGRGAVKFARGTTRLDLDGGKVEDLVIRTARMDWPRRGAPRLQATLDGRLDAGVLREALDAQGLEDLAGAVMLEAEARGEQELRDPRAWRVVAHVSDATMPLGGGLPQVEKLAGTIRYSAGQLRGLALEGSWLGGPVAVESRRSGNRGLGFAMNGVADAAPLLHMLGQSDAAQRVNGQFRVDRTAQPGANDGWQLSLSSNLAGLESRLPEPFDKTRARTLPIKAELGISRAGCVSSWWTGAPSRSAARYWRCDHGALRRAGRLRRAAPLVEGRQRIGTAARPAAARTYAPGAGGGGGLVAGRR
jgi:hypothetical protein